MNEATPEFTSRSGLTLDFAPTESWQLAVGVGPGDKEPNKKGAAGPHPGRQRVLAGGLVLMGHHPL